MASSEEIDEFIKQGIAAGLTDAQIEAGVGELTQESEAPPPSILADAASAAQRRVAANEARTAQIGDWEKERGTTLSSALNTGARTVGEYMPTSLIAKALEKMGVVSPETVTTVRDANAGMAGGAVKAITGARQALSDDPGLLQDEAIARLKGEELTKDNPGWAKAGDVVGQAIPYVLGGELLGAAKLPSLFTGNLARGAVGVGMGAGAGALQGATTPLTPEESAAGNRLKNAMFGGAAGAAGGALGPMVSGVNNIFKNAAAKETFEQARRNFGKDYGISEGYNSGESINKVAEALRGEVGRRQGVSSGNYELADTVAGNLGNPRVPVNQLNLENATGNPVVRDALGLSAPKKVTTSPAAIGDERGIIEVAQAQRDLAGIARELEVRDPAAYRLLMEKSRSLGNDIEAGTDPLLGPIKAMYGDAADYHKTMVVPHTGPKTAVDQFSKGGESGTDFDKMFREFYSGPQSGSNLVPLKELLPPEVFQEAQRAAMHQNLYQKGLGNLNTSGTLAEGLARSPADRAQLNALIGHAEKTAGSGALMKAMQAISSAPTKVGMPFLERSLFGVNRLGHKKLSQSELEHYANALRGATLGAQYGKEPEPLQINRGRD